MNLAQVVDYDFERRSFRLCPERAYQPNRADVAPVPPVVRQHEDPRRDAPVHQVTPRSTLRNAGQEIMQVLRGCPRYMRFGELSKALPHVSYHKLQVRLSTMVSREDIVRTGHRRDFRYGLSSTAMSSC